MKWAIEFMGEQKPLSEVWNDDLARIISPVKDSILDAFATASDQGALSEIEIVFFVDDERTWGVRFYGDSAAVEYAADLVGPAVKVRRQPN